MSTIRQQKEAVVEQIQEKISKNQLAIFTDYRGLNVANITELRRKLRECNSEMTIYKNTFSRMALNGLEIKYPEDVLIGPTAIITAGESVAETAKILVKFAKQHDVVKIKGGVLENKCITDNEIQEIAKLPSREELIAKTVGAIKAPITGLVMTLSGPLRGFVYALNSIKDKKSGGDQ
jgi:large subunit ribosomal protein L10